jgi:hypothetical protein
MFSLHAHGVWWCTGVGQLPVVGSLGMREKRPIHIGRVFFMCFEIFHFWLNPCPHPQKLWMLISCTFLRGFQQFKLSWMHEEISYKFCLETIVIPSLPKNSQRTMSYYYSFGHQPTYPNCSWYHHGPKK